MSAILKSVEARFEAFEPGRADQLNSVLAVELRSYAHPWSRGNFIDALNSGHQAQLLMADDVLLGYFIAMKGVDEVHLLNIAVAPGYQRQGWSLVMLDALALWARNQPGVQWLWLEVRPSNTRACAVYERYGFRLVGHRRDYYPTSTGSIKTVREDALVMSRRLV